MKKVFIIIGGLLGLLIVAAIVVPLVVDVDKYRPLAVQAVNERLNGKFELGKLKLSLWGQIRIDIASLSLADAAGRKILTVENAFFHFPLLPLLSGSPVMTLKLQKPEVAVVSDKSGKMNVMGLMKASAETPLGTGQPPAGGQTAPGDMAIPGIAARARFGMELRDADILFKDEKTELTNHLRNFNVVLKDVSLSRPWEVQIWGDLDTKMAKVVDLKGPIRIELTADPKVVDGRLSSFAARLKGNFDALEIKMPGGLFKKGKGIAANIDGTFSTAISGSGANMTYEAKIEKFVTKFFNAEIQLDGSVRQAGTTDVKIALKTNEVDLKPWNQLIPMLKDYELEGIAKLTANAGGTADKLEYQADFGITNLSAKSPSLKTQPKMNLSVKVLPDRIEKIVFNLKAPGNDLSIDGRMTSFSKPNLVATVRSSGMDIDQLVVLPPLYETPPAGTAVAPTEDYDKMLDPLRANPMMVGMTMDLGVQMALMKVYDVKMTDIAGKVTMRNLAMAIDSFGLKVWGGAVKMSGATDMKPARPTYRFDADIANLSIQQAVESQFKLFKNTLIGNVSAKIEGTGTSYNPIAAMNNLNGKGSFRSEKAKFATIDVGKMVTEGIAGSLGKIAEKVPPLRGKTLPALPNIESRYALMTSDFTITGGKFISPNFVAKAEPNAGIDLNGSTTVGMVDYALDARWEVVDTYNLTKARDLSLDVNGIKVEHVLAKGNEPVRFPVSVGCNALAPCYKYIEVPEYLGKIVASNLAGGAKAKVGSAVTQKVLEKAPPPLQNAIKGFGKKLFGK